MLLGSVSFSFIQNGPYGVFLRFVNRDALGNLLGSEDPCRPAMIRTRSLDPSFLL